MNQAAKLDARQPAKAQIGRASLWNATSSKRYNILSQVCIRIYSMVFRLDILGVLHKLSCRILQIIPCISDLFPKLFFVDSNMTQHSGEKKSLTCVVGIAPSGLFSNRLFLLSICKNQSKYVFLFQDSASNSLVSFLIHRPPVHCDVYCVLKRRGNIQVYSSS